MVTCNNKFWGISCFNFVPVIQRYELLDMWNSHTAEYKWENVNSSVELNIFFLPLLLLLAVVYRNSPSFACICLFVVFYFFIHNFCRVCFFLFHASLFNFCVVFFFCLQQQSPRKLEIKSNKNKFPSPETGEREL